MYLCQWCNKKHSICIEKALYIKKSPNIGLNTHFILKWIYYNNMIIRRIQCKTFNLYNCLPFYIHICILMKKSFNVSSITILIKSNTQMIIFFILNYSWHNRESGWKPHSYCIFAEYCFSPIKWIKKEHPFVVKLRCSKS